MLGSREDAEETTQDVFMRILNSLDDFRGDSSLATWIWRITTNVCLTRRKKKSIASVSLDNIEFDPPDGRIEDCSRQERSFLARERSEIITRCISLLSPTESAVITLFYLEELSYEEISVILKMPVGTVSTALHRGRQRLGELLREEKEEL
jgi:RNA polymerase sigma-70 factor (ECF subfamily)